MLRYILPLLILCDLSMAAEVRSDRTCRILFLGREDTVPDKVYLFDGSRAQEVELPKMSLSPVYQLADGAIGLSLLPSKPESPQKINPAAPSAKVPDGVNDLYLILSADPANPVLPIKIQVIDVDPAGFKLGQMLWFNLTNCDVGGKVGNQMLVIHPNSRVLLGAPASGQEDFPVNLTYRIPEKPALYPLCETSWRFHPDSRSVYFVLHQQDSRVPRVMGFRDYRSSRDGNGKDP